MKVLFTGGGTAGHINPALAAAGYLLQKEPDAQILYVGTVSYTHLDVYKRQPKDFPVCVCGRKPQGRLVYKKGLAPSAQEVAENPRARSARLRVIEKLPQEQ